MRTNFAQSQNAAGRRALRRRLGRAGHQPAKRPLRGRRSARSAVTRLPSSIRPRHRRKPPFSRRRRRLPRPAWPQRRRRNNSEPCSIAWASSSPEAGPKRRGWRSASRPPRNDSFNAACRPPAMCWCTSRTTARAAASWPIASASRSSSNPTRRVRAWESASSTRPTGSRPLWNIAFVTTRSRSSSRRSPVPNGRCRCSMTSRYR